MGWLASKTVPTPYSDSIPAQHYSARYVLNGRNVRIVRIDQRRPTGLESQLRLLVTLGLAFKSHYLFGSGSDPKRRRSRDFGGASRNELLSRTNSPIHSTQNSNEGMGIHRACGRSFHRAAHSSLPYRKLNRLPQTPGCSLDSVCEFANEIWTLLPARRVKIPITGTVGSA